MYIVHFTVFLNGILLIIRNSFQLWSPIVEGFDDTEKI